MNSKRFREILLVAALIAVPALVLRASLRAPSDLNWLDRIVLRGSAPVQSAVSRGTGSLGDAWRRYVYLVDVEGRNTALAAENERLRAELSQSRRDLSQGAAREDLLGFRRRVPSETLAARVVGVETSPYFRVLRVKLDRGDGEVRAGMPVLVPSGVVGSVRRVFGAYSDVLLAIDPESSIDVVAPRTGAQGTLRGVAGEYKFRMRLLRTDDVREGDPIVTSGNDGVYPRDVPIGTVTRVSSPDAGLWRDAEISPSVDFPRLREVLVVLAPPPPADPESAPGAPKRAAPPHRGLGTPR